MTELKNKEYTTIEADMAGKKFWKLEYTVTLFVICTVVLLLLPFNLESTVQANFISRWIDKYSRLEYMFKVINAHESDEIIKSFKYAKTPKEREHILITLIQPYFRMHKEKIPKRYCTKFMNKANVARSNKYYFDDLYISDNGMIVGIKDLAADNIKEPGFMIMFDINGLLPPNTWGKDIFGVNIHEGGISPFGEDMTMNELKHDCSRRGTGVGCSYYYKIGGSFDG